MTYNSNKTEARNQNMKITNYQFILTFDLLDVGIARSYKLCRCLLYLNMVYLLLRIHGSPGSDIALCTLILVMQLKRSLLMLNSVTCMSNIR